jgi:hypothetical protein
MKAITYLSAGGAGHHFDYDRLFAAVAKDIDALLTLPSSCAANNEADPRFYAMFDTRPRETSKALLRAILRSLRGQRTIGLFFRPGSCFIDGSPKSALRRLLFRLVAHLPNIYILSIVPFDLSPKFSSVATNWIYDPQLWDLSYLEVPTLHGTAALGALLLEVAKHRRIIVALGGQNRSKGFDYMVDLWEASGELREEYLFVASGEVAPQSRDAADRFQRAGGLLIDRRIQNEELFYLYRKAHAVWNCYAPDYNQSSGIHGRAVQLGVPAIVRAGSYLESLGEMLPHPTLALPFSRTSEAITLLLDWNPVPPDGALTEALVRRMRDHSISVLAHAIGTSPRMHST